MSLLTCASGNPVYRGYDYYICDKVIVTEELGGGQSKGYVEGSSDKPYEVFIDVNHPRKSHCNCPHADGKRIVCKHQIAMFFKAFPEEAEKYKAELKSYYDYEEKRHDDEERTIVKFLGKCKKSDLEEIVWQYDRFVKDYLEM